MKDRTRYPTDVQGRNAQSRMYVLGCDEEYVDLTGPLSFKSVPSSDTQLDDIPAGETVRFTGPDKMLMVDIEALKYGVATIRDDERAVIERDFEDHGRLLTFAERTRMDTVQEMQAMVTGPLGDIMLKADPIGAKSIALCANQLSQSIPFAAGKGPLTTANAEVEDMIKGKLDRADDKDAERAKSREIVSGLVAGLDKQFTAIEAAFAEKGFGTYGCYEGDPEASKMEAMTHAYRGLPALPCLQNVDQN